MPTLYFYKGTTMPMFALEQKDAFVLAKEQLALGLRMSNISLEDQAKDYFDQLNIIEEAMYKYCNVASKEGFKKVSLVLNHSEEEIYSLWCINICCLLILKKIPDDNMNGITQLDGAF